MSEPGPPHKKQRICGLLTYNFRETSNLVEKPEYIVLEMGDSKATTQNTILYTSGCSTCSVLIIVAKMSNDEILHGMYHAYETNSTGNISDAFDTLMGEFKKVNGKKIIIADYYLVTIPELRRKRSQDTHDIGYPVIVLSPVRPGIRQLNDAPNKNTDPYTSDVESDVEQDGMSSDTMDELDSGIAVKMSKGVIDVKYTPQTGLT